MEAWRGKWEKEDFLLDPHRKNKVFTWNISLSSSYRNKVLKQMYIYWSLRSSHRKKKKKSWWKKCFSLGSSQEKKSHHSSSYKKDPYQKQGSLSSFTEITHFSPFSAGEMLMDSWTFTVNVRINNKRFPASISDTFNSFSVPEICTFFFFLLSVLPVIHWQWPPKALNVFFCFCYLVFITHCTLQHHIPSYNTVISSLPRRVNDHSHVASKTPMTPETATTTAVKR